jgi:hypothetical protein
LGDVSRKPRTIGEIAISPSAIEAAWQRQATEEAIAAARAVIGSSIPPGTPIGRLSDIEWGWLAAGILFGWISTRARQAASEQLDTEQTIRRIALDPDPWDAGAVEAILPALADALPVFDWSRPVTDWPRQAMTEFLLVALRLAHRAREARDSSDRGVTRKTAASTIARETNAAAGGPLMTHDELNDEIGF